MKRAPEKNRLALVLNLSRNVAGIRDDGLSGIRIELLEEGGEETTSVSFDGETPADLVSTLAEEGATDVVASYFEDNAFGDFEGEGFALWLVPAKMPAQEAIREWHANQLQRAEAGKEITVKGHGRHAPDAERHPQA
jgi:hypothetical protein